MGKKSESNNSSSQSIQDLIQLAIIRSEKCDLKEAKNAYETALELAKKEKDVRLTIEAVSGLLRLAGEAKDERMIQDLDSHLTVLMSAHPKKIPPMAWHCKGAIASHRKEPLLAQRYFHRYIRAVSDDPEHAPEGLAKGWLMIAITFSQRNHFRRAEFLGKQILKHYGPKKFRGINGITHLLLGNIAERQKNFELAWDHFKKAQSEFLGEHNWFYHLYVLYGYARLSRLQQNYTQAYWYLDLLVKATEAAEFGLLKSEIQGEIERLKRSAVDLLIDARKGVVKTKTGESISLKKQYVLLYILEVLSQAHAKEGADVDRGVTKAEIIQNVWKESYRPEAHDNKLYYNINRLRKLIEPDVKKPQYVLNWKEGYRLAPGLRVQFVGGSNTITLGEVKK
jgi:DNA-binding winged helix-turn-helix (wHTH) protein